VAMLFVCLFVCLLVGMFVALSVGFSVSLFIVTCYDESKAFFSYACAQDVILRFRSIYPRYGYEPCSINTPYQAKMGVPQCTNPLRPGTSGTLLFKSFIAIAIVSNTTTKYGEP
jgi:hypothetical protein